MGRRGRRDSCRSGGGTLSEPSQCTSVAIDSDVQIHLERAKWKACVGNLHVYLKQRIPKVCGLTGEVYIKKQKCEKRRRRCSPRRSYVQKEKVSGDCVRSVKSCSSSSRKGSCSDGRRRGRGRRGGW